MMQLITSELYGEFVNELAAMHRLRYRVFKDRLHWDVQVSGDLEIDEFDALHPAYLLQRGADGSFQGCVRLLPSTGPTMLRDVFPSLLGSSQVPAVASLWESSRFALDLPPEARKAETGIAVATFELFAGMIEFGLSRRLTDIVTVTDARMERILRRAGWPLRRIAEPRAIGNTLAVAGYLEVSTAALLRIRNGGGITSPALWAPVIVEAA
ncbi:MAG TPA: acyl-homoserine-lactone synthase [Stellaceae bacterium]|nr:acyl-homoserine-lactone synthase [Stellaceae bacterium]